MPAFNDSRPKRLRLLPFTRYRSLPFEIPEPWQSLFLSLPVVIWRALDTNEFSPKTVSNGAS